MQLVHLAGVGMPCMQAFAFAAAWDCQHPQLRIAHDFATVSVFD